MLNGLGGILSIDWVRLLGVITHTHHLFAFFGRIGQGIPDKLAAGTPGKIAHVVGFVNPGFELGGPFGFFGFFGLFKRNNFDRLFGLLGLLPTGVLSWAEQGGIIEAFARCCNYVIGGKCHFDHKIAEGQGKFSTSGELFVLPTRKIAVGTKPGIPLGDGENVIVLVREIFITATGQVGRTVAHNFGNVDAVHQIIMPLDAESKRTAWLECFG